MDRTKTTEFRTRLTHSTKKERRTGPTDDERSNVQIVDDADDETTVRGPLVSRVVGSVNTRERRIRDLCIFQRKTNTKTSIFRTDDDARKASVRRVVCILYERRTRWTFRRVSVVFWTRRICYGSRWKTKRSWDSFTFRHWRVRRLQTFERVHRESLERKHFLRNGYLRCRYESSATRDVVVLASLFISLPRRAAGRGTRQ